MDFCHIKLVLHSYLSSGYFFPLGNLNSVLGANQQVSGNSCHCGSCQIIQVADYQGQHAFIIPQLVFPDRLEFLPGWICAFWHAKGKAKGNHNRHHFLTPQIEYPLLNQCSIPEFSSRSVLIAFNFYGVGKKKHIDDKNTTTLQINVLFAVMNLFPHFHP